MAQLERYAFSFGCGQAFPNRLIVLRGNYCQARDKMVKLFGAKWSFQYIWTEEKMQELASYNMHSMTVGLAMSLLQQVKQEDIIKIGVLEWKKLS